MNTLRPSTILLVLLLSFLPCCRSDEPNERMRFEIRNWSDSSGSFGMQGRLMKRGADYVEVKKDSGQVIKIPLNRLSAVDQRYVNANLPGIEFVYSPTAERTSFTRVELRDSGERATVFRRNGFAIPAQLEDVTRSSVTFKAGRLKRMTLSGTDVAKIDIEGDTLIFNRSKRLFESSRKIAMWTEYPLQRPVSFQNMTDQDIYIRVTEINDEAGLSSTLNRGVAIPSRTTVSSAITTSSIRYETFVATSDLLVARRAETTALSANRDSVAVLSLAENDIPPPFRITPISLRQGSKSQEIPAKFVTKPKRDFLTGRSEGSTTTQVAGGTETIFDRLVECRLELKNLSTVRGRVTVEISLDFVDGSSDKNANTCSGSMVVDALETKTLKIDVDTGGRFSGGGYRVQSVSVVRAWMDS